LLESILVNWKTAIIPTDTVYGLVCRIDDQEAINKIYEIKRRDKDKPLILLAASSEVLRQYIDVMDNRLDALTNHYWPGPLTMVLPKSAKLPDFINPGFQTIGMRVPHSKTAVDFLDSVPGKIVLSTSANLSGEEPVLLYREALKLKDSVDLIVEPKNGEKCSGDPSTIVSFDGDKFKLLRQGEIFISLG